MFYNLNHKQMYKCTSANINIDKSMFSTEMLEKIASNLWISNSYPNCSQYEQFTFEYLILFMDVGIENLEFMKIIYYSAGL